MKPGIVLGILMWHTQTCGGKNPLVSMAHGSVTLASMQNTQSLSDLTVLKTSHVLCCQVHQVCPVKWPSVWFCLGPSVHLLVLVKLCQLKPLSDSTELNFQSVSVRERERERESLSQSQLLVSCITVTFCFLTCCFWKKKRENIAACWCF